MLEQNKTIPNRRPGKILTVLFWSLILVFIFIFLTVELMVSPLGPLKLQQFAGSLIFPFIIIILILGVSVFFIIAASREHLEKLFKSFLILTGASAIGFSVTFLLHTLVYSVFKGSFWYYLISGHGITLDIIFGILLSLLFPIGFVTGIIGSIALFFKRRKLAGT
jgi:hypothetical protein